MLPTNLLTEYIETFYGYGNWQSSDFWFVGIEEGGGNEIDNVQRRLESWQALGKTDLIDCKAHHINMGSFTEKNSLKLHSQTWTRLILIKLGYLKGDYTKEEIVKLQMNNWGGLNSSNLLIELLPLPSPGLGKWYYFEKDWVDLSTNLSFLKDRKSYEEYVLPKRINNIRSKINSFHPSVVVFYGKVMANYWTQIIGEIEFTTTKINDKYIVKFGKNENTLFVQCPQPSYIRGYAFWKELGCEIRTLLNKE